jgi:hypothetical protein
MHVGQVVKFIRNELVKRAGFDMVHITTGSASFEFVSQTLLFRKFNKMFLEIITLLLCFTIVCCLDRIGLEHIASQFLGSSSTREF